MCLIALAHCTSERFPLVIAANRDEFFARPTRPLHRWDDDPRVTGGRDLRAGGSWLAVRDDGRFAAVTNVRGGRMEGGPSRGALVAEFVRGDADPLAYAASIRGDDYAGFHLIAGIAGDRIAHVSNEGAAPSLLPPGIFAVSNGRPGSDWPKVELARRAMAEALDSGDVAGALLRFLTTRRGGAIEEEVFVDLPEHGYGTRSSTVVLVDADGRVSVTERLTPERD